MFTKFMTLTLALVFVAGVVIKADDYISYPVKAGDTLQKISDATLKDFKFMPQLLAYNNISHPSQIKPDSTVLKVPYSLSKDRVAHLSMSFGQLRIQRGSEAKAASQGMSLLQGDVIITAAGSKAEIQLDEGSIVHVGPSTQFSMAAYAYNNGNRNTNLALDGGSMSMRVTKLNGEGEFKVSTVTAVAGVRGTSFGVTVDPVTKQTSVVCYTGAVALVDPKAPVDKTTGKPVETAKVEAGHAVNVDTNGVPSKVFEIPAKIEWAD